jgi:hypothetical protein
MNDGTRAGGGAVVEVGEMNHEINEWAGTHIRAFHFAGQLII